MAMLNYVFIALLVGTSAGSLYAQTSAPTSSAIPEQALALITPEQGIEPKGLRRGRYVPPAFARGQAHPPMPAELAVKRPPRPPELANMGARKSVKRQLAPGVTIKDGVVFIERKLSPEELSAKELAQKRADSTAKTADVAQEQALNLQKQILTGQLPGMPLAVPDSAN